MILTIVLSTSLFLLVSLGLVLAFRHGASGVSHADAEPLVMHR